MQIEQTKEIIKDINAALIDTIFGQPNLRTKAYIANNVVFENCGIRVNHMLLKKNLLTCLKNIRPNT